MMKAIYILMASFAAVCCGCADAPSTKELVNTPASLPSTLNFSKLNLKVIASFINKSQGTMSTLYGNSVALEAYKTFDGKIRTGEQVALIDWKQQQDKNWFGAKIPGTLQSIEFLSFSTKGGKAANIQYKRYKGVDLVLDTDTLNREKRIGYILSQKPSILP